MSFFFSQAPQKHHINLLLFYYFCLRTLLFGLNSTFYTSLRRETWHLLYVVEWARFDKTDSYHIESINIDIKLKSTFYTSLWRKRPNTCSELDRINIIWFKLKMYHPTCNWLINTSIILWKMTIDSSIDYNLLDLIWPLMTFW